MKKEVVFVFSMFLFLLLVLTPLYALPEEHTPNFQEVSKKLDTQEKVDVIIKLKPGFSVKSTNKENTFNDNSFHTSLNKNELENLKDQIEYIVPIRTFHTTLQESVSIVNASLTWPLQILSSSTQINLTGQTQTVCVIDTGVNFSHPDLIGKNVTPCNIDCIDKSCISNCSETDLQGHGTHVAGIVGASGNILGIAQGVNIIGLKVFPGSLASGATNAGINHAIDWCVSNSETYNISVISLSLGSSILYPLDCDVSNSDFNSSITSAFNKNISVVVATGNDANTTGISSPACISKAIPVGDTYDANVGSVNWIGTCNDSTTALDQIVCHANRNSLVKLFAPGALINSTSITGGYIEYGGTSMATPMVSGAIAIINQLLNLTSQTKTPHEIEDLLNQTGKIIHDDVGGLNFSRINIYPAILELDNIAPNVTLSTPADNSINISTSQNFVCNTSDWQLSNVTFYLWNSSNTLIYNETIIISGTENTTEFNYSGLDYDTYEWSCLAYDTESNSAFSGSNFTLIIGGIQTTLTLPETETYQNQNQTNFTCTSQSEENYDLMNITFYLWNSSNTLIYNETVIISGTENTTEFNYTLPEQDTYNWNCLSLNNNSNSSWANTNYTLTYENVIPNLTLVLPLPDSVTSSSVSKTFRFNVSDSLNTTCNLIVNSAIDSIKNISNFTQTQNFTKTFTPGTYAWQINCTDLAGNSNISSSNSFTITTPSTGGSTSSSPGGGGDPPEGLTYNPTENQTSTGYTRDFKSKDKIKFSISVPNKNLEQHTITLNEINTTKNYVKLIIASNPINATLTIGQIIKLNITSPDYYDLYIKLESINAGTKRANLTVQTIHDPIIIKVIKEVIETPDNQKEQETLAGKSILWLVIISIIIIFIIAVLVKVITHLVEKRLYKDKISGFASRFRKEKQPQ